LCHVAKPEQEPVCGNNQDNEQQRYKRITYAISTASHAAIDNRHDTIQKGKHCA